MHNLLILLWCIVRQYCRHSHQFVQHIQRYSHHMVNGWRMWGNGVGMGMCKPHARHDYKGVRRCTCIHSDTPALVCTLHTSLTWHDPCPIPRLHTALSTVWGMSRHNTSYQTFLLLSNEIRSALHRPCMLARCMPCTDPHPVIGSPCRPTWCGLSPGSMPNKQKGPMPPTQHIDKRGL